MGFEFDINGALNAAGDFANNAMKAAGDAAQQAGNAVGGAIQNTQKAAGDAAKFIGDQIADTQKRIESDGIQKVAMDTAQQAGNAIGDAANTVGETAAYAYNSAAKAITHDDSDQKEYQAATDQYNIAYNDLNHPGFKLLSSREKSAEFIDYITELINSIAHTPKTFETDIEEIIVQKKSFTDTEEFARKEIDNARKNAASAAAGAAVALLAPTAAIWTATTFGTASTGVAISALSGAAANSAALAWLGGGALAAGGGGIAGGNALLALAGPVGWGLAGATILGSAFLYTHGQMEVDAERQKNLIALKKNTEEVKETTLKVTALEEKINNLRINLSHAFLECAPTFGADYTELNPDMQMKLGTLVNNTKSLSALLAEHIAVTSDDATTEDEKNK
ncbi:hypothetical protein EJ419_06580 [Alloscardovia theropitheci]|uniref:Uncharacterized protein n=1 Tax=Alloscardovia theropitheci TaxID=2496842 RepID=A0A4R0QUG8_9BIFI|nr:hypothetical protein [Alloscardovia theropitheci]TCD53637.1 hypothetical protein EJ419_06580 [Alloscardovia theropitheci]